MLICQCCSFLKKTEGGLKLLACSVCSLGNVMELQCKCSQVMY